MPSIRKSRATRGADRQSALKAAVDVGEEFEVVAEGQAVIATNGHDVTNGAAAEPEKLTRRQRERLQRDHEKGLAAIRREEALAGSETGIAEELDGIFGRKAKGRRPEAGGDKDPEISDRVDARTANRAGHIARKRGDTQQAIGDVVEAGVPVSAAIRWIDPKRGKFTLDA